MLHSVADFFIRSTVFILVGLVFAVELKAETAVGGRSLEQELNRIDELIWLDPWAARNRLQAVAPSVAVASSEIQAEYYLRLAHALQYLYFEREFADAITAGLAALTPQSPPDTQILLQILDGVRASRQGQYQQAEVLIDQAIVAARRHDLSFLAVFAQVEQAFARMLAGDYELALIGLQHAFHSAINQKEPFLVALANEAFGALYAYVDEYEQAVKHYQKALESYKNLGYRVYEAEASYGLAISHRYAKRWDQALVAFQHYRELTEHNHSPHSSFIAAYGLGMTYAEMGDCELALAAISQALASLDTPLDMKAELYKRQAVCLAREGATQSALRAVSSAQKMFASLPELTGTHWELEVLEAEAEVRAVLGDYRQAYDLLRDYHQKITALLREDSSERLIRFRVQLEDERRDYEIALLKQQAKVDALKLQRQQKDNDVQRKTIVYWIVCTAIAVLFLAWQLRNTRRLRRLSHRDGLTGLYNRRFIFDYLEKLTNELPLDKGQLTLILIDVDDFKQINDRYGHPVGDKVLKTFAKISAEVLRPGDKVARVGGEEFLCVLPRTTPAQAVVVAERLLLGIREHVFALPEGGTIQVTVSMGVAGYGADYPSLDELYAAADWALYKAKAKGKDQLFVGGA